MVSPGTWGSVGGVAGMVVVVVVPGDCAHVALTICWLSKLNVVVPSAPKRRTNSVSEATSSPHSRSTTAARCTTQPLVSSTMF